MTVKDGFYGFVGGTVSRVFENVDYPRIVVEYMDGDKAVYPSRVTVWGSHGVSEGDRVKFKGWVRAKARTYDKKDGTTGNTADVSLSNAELVEHEAGAANSFDPRNAGFTLVDESAPF